MKKLELPRDLKKLQDIPSNIEAEQNLLGSILVNNDIIDEIANTIKPEKFYDPIHKYRGNRELNRKGMITILLFKNYLKKSRLDELRCCSCEINKIFIFSQTGY